MVGDGPGVSEGGGSSLPVGDRQASETGLPAGVITFVMTDIEGSTRLFREPGERYADILATHQALLWDDDTGHYVQLASRANVAATTGPCGRL
jgi:hypothetical protein